nr:unnamed protein product [Callosobruchus analis]
MLTLIYSTTKNGLKLRFLFKISIARKSDYLFDVNLNKVLIERVFVSHFIILSNTVSY